MQDLVLTPRTKLLRVKPRPVEPTAPLRLGGSRFGSGPLMSLQHLPAHTRAGTHRRLYMHLGALIPPLSSLTSSFGTRSPAEGSACRSKWPRRGHCQRYSVVSIHARTPRTAFLHRRSSESSVGTAVFPRPRWMGPWEAWGSFPRLAPGDVRYIELGCQESVQAPTFS